MQYKYYYKCVDCNREFFTTDVMYLCPHCEKENSSNMPPRGVLKTLYNYAEITGSCSRYDLFRRLYHDNFLSILPVKETSVFSYLRVGKTPCYKVEKLDGKGIDCNLFLKDDSQNPTFSFKDRASTLVSAFAKEKGIDTIVAASTGNAGSSLAGICASQNQKAVIFVPAKAPKAKLTQIVMYGASIVPVDGTYDDAFDLCVAATKKYGWYNRNTAFNPLTIEGKKTVSFEIFDNIGSIVPDRIFVPVGDGVIISGVYKGFEDLLQLGIIEKMPVIVAVQSEGSRNIVQNLSSEKFTVTPSSTIADSISVDIPRNFYMAKKFINDYNGEAVTVSDNEIIEASVKLSRNTGIFSEPAASTAFAGFLKYSADNKLSPGSSNVVLLTGSGLKDLNSVQSKISIPDPIKAELSAVEKLLNL